MNTSNNVYLLTKFGYPSDDIQAKCFEEVFTDYDDLVNFCAEETLQEITDCYKEDFNEAVADIGRDYLKIQQGELQFRERKRNLSGINEVIDSLSMFCDTDNFIYVSETLTQSDYQIHKWSSKMQYAFLYKQ